MNKELTNGSVLFVVSFEQALEMARGEGNGAPVTDVARGINIPEEKRKGIIETHYEIVPMTISIVGIH